MSNAQIDNTGSKNPDSECVSKKEVYLDNNATTWVLPQVMEAVNDAMHSCYGNPSSSHITGVRAKHVLESARSLARKVIGAETGEIIFTSGATEGIQTAIVSSLLSIREKNIDTENCYLLYGSTEHKAVPNTLEYWNKVFGINAKIIDIPVNDKGILDFDFIAEYVPKSLMICTMAVNNETGVYQDLHALEAVIRGNSQDVLWMVDCVQTLGKSALSISETTIDFAPFSGHKIYTPKGVGMLYVREGAPFMPFIAGGGQESGNRSGTENIPGIAAMGRVFELLLDEGDDTFKPKSTLNSYRLQIADTLETVFPGVVFNNSFEHSVPTTINFSVPGLSSKEVMDIFDAASIRVSSGSACSSKVTRSFVLDAMGLESWQSESAIRMSFGPAATQDEIDDACDAIKRVSVALKHSCLILNDVLDDHNTKLKHGFIELKYGECCCWMYIDSKALECVIIDPLPQLTDRLSRWVSGYNLTVKAVIDTHTHFDHDPYHATLKDILVNNVPEQLAATDGHGWPNNVDGHLMLADKHELPYLSVGDMRVAIINTPGHTDDSRSVMFINQQNDISLALVGDLIMPGGFGRTDVKTSNPQAFYQSLQTLGEVLTPSTKLGSSHDYQHNFVTTLKAECEENELLAKVLANEIDAEAFKTAKATTDAKLECGSGGYLCGLVEVSTVDEPYSLPADDIIGFLAENPNAKVIDVRECYECEAGDIQSQLRMNEPAINVPLSELADFAINGEHFDNGPLLLVCRTGNRSMLACKSLLRLGYPQVYNIKGGLALFNG